jgi:hypothetical protein
MPLPINITQLTIPIISNTIAPMFNNVFILCSNMNKDSIIFWILEIILELNKINRKGQQN